MMIYDYSALSARATRGELTAADIVRLHKLVDDLGVASMEAQAARRRVHRHEQCVKNYAVKMAPVFGLERSLPVGDRA